MLSILDRVSVCRNGEITPGCTLGFSDEDANIEIFDCPVEGHDNEVRDLRLDQCRVLSIGSEDIISPGLIEMQTNGLVGVHFSTLTPNGYEEKLAKCAREMVRNGVTAWYATVPTVAGHRWKEILPLLAPRSFEDVGGSNLLGVHVEGPYLNPAKKGAHNETYMKTPALHPYRDIYGEHSLQHTIKIITLAPELDGALEMIQDIRKAYPHITIMLGHSTATYETGLAAMDAGAKGLTHIFNAMPPLHHRDPGLTGLISIPQPTTTTTTATPVPAPQQPYYTIIPDLIHLHPAILRLAYTSNPTHTILITDSIELAGLPDGTYPPNDQITYPQQKLGNRATNIVDVTKGEQEETLIGSCITLSDGVRNMVGSAGIGVAEAVGCASENVVRLLGLQGRGVLGKETRADFVVWRRDVSGGGDGMREGERWIVKETWMGGRKVYDVAGTGEVE